MSWDAMLFKVPDGVTKIDELPHDYRPPLIGTTDEVHAALSSLLPDQEHRPGATSYWDGCSWIELHYDYEKTGVVDSIGVRSNGGQTAFAALKVVCVTLGLAMFDNQTGELSSFDETTHESLAAFRAFRKQVMG